MASAAEAGERRMGGLIVKITVSMVVDVPLSPYCGNCLRREVDKDNNTWCALFNRFLWMSNGRFVKCRECYKALYDAIEKER